MTAFRPTDYMQKAKELRASRLGVPLTTAHPTHPVVVPNAPVAEPAVATVKATRKHALITTPEQLAELTSSLEGATRVALDLETTGLDPRCDRARLLTLATERGVWIVDCFEVDPHPLFPVLAEKELVIHNAAFDLGMLYERGFGVGENGKVIDTMLLSQMLEGLRPKEKENR